MYVKLKIHLLYGHYLFDMLLCYVDYFPAIECLISDNGKQLL